MSSNDGANQTNREEKEPNGDNQEIDTNPIGESVPQQVEDHSPESPPESQPEADRRRHQRGGRKTKPSDNHKPWSERNGRLEQHLETETLSKEEEERQATTTQTSKCATCGHGVGSSSETGFKAFNLRRAASSGGRAPFGVRVDRSREESKKEKKSKGKSKKKKKKKQQESSDEESEDSSNEEPEKRKPVAIRLDLNLELEIFLRAKVKGDITITFLE